jgi:hypothetical protein
MKKKIIYTILGVITIIVGCNIFTILGFINRPSIPTVNGPEATNLLSATHGYIVYDVPVGGIKAVALPGLNVITIREEDKGHEPVHSVCGPDNNGRIVYVENHMGDDAKHFLKLTSVKGSEDELIFTRKGDALWDHVIGEYLALSPVGGLASFVGNLTPEQMYKPDAYLEVGPLEIWNIVTKSKIETKVIALDAGLTWFPDGRKLVYTKLTLRTEIPPVDSGCNVRSSFGNEWPTIPAVFVYDLLDHSSTFLYAGWHPVVSPDGKSVLVSGFEKNHCLVNVETRTAVPIDWPSQYGSVIAFTSSNVILHMGLPTAGAKPKWTNHNSPLVGPKPMFSIKLNNLSNGAFQTVLDYVDPRREISYGQMHE